MKFTLTYDGSLPASGNKAKVEEKWEIRQAIDPQLRDLWQSHPALRFVADNRHFPSDGTYLRQRHHDHPGPIERHGEHANREILDLCEDIEKHGTRFRPLVRNSFALHCGLKITFLRAELPGKVYQGGDLDGRMKTILDALAMPQHKEQILAPSETPIYCLLEDDSLISSLQIESERLLGHQTNSKDHVRLNIEVDVRVRQATIYNQSFLG